MEMNDRLTTVVSADEMVEAVFELGAFKAPSPDDFSSIFYHTY